MSGTPIARDQLIATMTTLLGDAVKRDAEGQHVPAVATSSSPLLGPEAVLSSLSLVSYIMDVEAALNEQHGVEVVLVNESALSRKQSPFRTVETLGDYVLELVGTAGVAGS